MAALPDHSAGRKLKDVWKQVPLQIAVGSLGGCPMPTATALMPAAAPQVESVVLLVSKAGMCRKHPPAGTELLNLIHGRIAIWTLGQQLPRLPGLQAKVSPMMPQPHKLRQASRQVDMWPHSDND